MLIVAKLLDGSETHFVVVTCRAIQMTNASLVFRVRNEWMGAFGAEASPYLFIT